MDKPNNKATNAWSRLAKWREMELSRQTRMNEKKYKVQLFYEKTLPSDVDISKASLVERNYVSNPKFGNVYELRHDIGSKTKHIKPEKTPTRVQENNIWLWKHEDQLTNHLQSRGYKTVRPRDGLKLSRYQKALEDNTEASSGIFQHNQLRSFPTSEDLRQRCAITGEHLRQRSMSLSGNSTGSSGNANSIDEECDSRGRSQSFSDYFMHRRPSLTTSTFNRHAYELNKPDSNEGSRTNNGNGESNAKDCSSTMLPYYGAIPAIQISHVNDHT